MAKYQLQQKLANGTMKDIPITSVNDIGKDPLTISGGGGTSHPVYTEANIDKWGYVYDKTYNNWTLKITGESGSRYLFNFTTNMFAAGYPNEVDRFGIEIANNDVEVTFYNTVYRDYWTKALSDPTSFVIYNTGLIFLTKSEEFSLGNYTLDINGCDCGPEYINNGGCSFDIGFPTSAEQRYSNELYFTLRKDEVGTLHVTVGLVSTF